MGEPNESLATRRLEHICRAKIVEQKAILGSVWSGGGGTLLQRNANANAVQPVE